MVDYRFWTVSTAYRFTKEIYRFSEKMTTIIICASNSRDLSWEKFFFFPAPIPRIRIPAQPLSKDSPLPWEGGTSLFQTPSLAAFGLSISRCWQVCSYNSQVSSNHTVLVNKRFPTSHRVLAKLWPKGIVVCFWWNRFQVWVLAVSNKYHIPCS